MLLHNLADLNPQVESEKFTSSWYDPSRFEPLTPKVTEAKSGFNPARMSIVFSKRSAAISDLGGNNSNDFVGLSLSFHKSVIFIFTLNNQSCENFFECSE